MVGRNSDGKLAAKNAEYTKKNRELSLGFLIRPLTAYLCVFLVSS